MKKIQITNWVVPCEKIKSEYGEIYFEEWLENEVVRMQRSDKGSVYYLESKIDSRYGELKAIYKRRRNLNDVKKEKRGVK